MDLPVSYLALIALARASHVTLSALGDGEEMPEGICSGTGCVILFLGRSRKALGLISSPPCLGPPG